MSKGNPKIAVPFNVPMIGGGAEWPPVRVEHGVSNGPLASPVVIGQTAQGIGTRAIAVGGLTKLEHFAGLIASRCELYEDEHRQKHQAKLAVSFAKHILNECIEQQPEMYRPPVPEGTH